MPRMTWQLLERYVQDGRGQGWGMTYRPWLWLRRRNPSPVSNQVAGAMLPGLNRECCFLSRTEWLTSLLCYWIGAIDVWEQYPLWPWPHPHGLHALPKTQHFEQRQSEGLLSIAKSAGIEHGVFFGTKVPYIATTDLAVIFQSEVGPRMAAIAVKASKALLDAEPADRMLARLELERRYHTALDNHFTTATENLFSKVFAGQLIWFSSAANLPSGLADPLRIIEFSAIFEEYSIDESIERGISVATAKTGLSKSNGNFLFRYCAWRRIIDIDLTKPVEISYPPNRGANKTVMALRTAIFGDAS